jgi:hypothetical protein
MSAIDGVRKRYVLGSIDSRGWIWLAPSKLLAAHPRCVIWPRRRYSSLTQGIAIIDGRNVRWPRLKCPRPRLAFAQHLISVRIGGPGWSHGFSLNVHQLRFHWVPFTPNPCAKPFRRKAGRQEAMVMYFNLVERRKDGLPTEMKSLSAGNVGRRSGTTT